jgi:hypothetical protein
MLQQCGDLATEIYIGRGVVAAGSLIEARGYRTSKASSYKMCEHAPHLNESHTHILNALAIQDSTRDHVPLSGPRCTLATSVVTCSNHQRL